jgi:DNA-binding FadR family transcriptional regulator
VFKQRGGALPRNAIPDHRRVYDAIVLGNAQAAGEAMRKLIELALEDTRLSMQRRSERR